MPRSKTLEQWIRTAALLFTAHATYAPCKEALTISLGLAAFLYESRFRLIPTQLSTFQDLIDAGEQRGYWRCDFDSMSGAYLLVIRHLANHEASSVDEAASPLENRERKLSVPLTTTTVDTLASTIAIGADVLFRLVASLVEDHSSYTPVVHAQAIPVPYLHMLFEDKVMSSPTGAGSFYLALEEGARRGFWDLVFDDSHLCEVVILH